MKISFCVVLCLVSLVTALHAEVSLTVYQRDLALLRDVRTVDLAKGENRIVFDQIASGMDRSSLRITPLSQSGDLQTISQSYEYDLADQERIWQKFLNKPFKFVKDDSAYSGVLRKLDDDFIYLEPEDRPGKLALVSRSGIDDMVFDEIPEGLALHPQVIWKVHSAGKKNGVKVELAYLLSGLSWQARYTAQVLAENRLRLQGDLTLVNSVDLDFREAQVSLIAGSPHRSHDPRILSDEDALLGVQTASRETGARFFEYRQYALPQPLTLHRSQTVGVSLIAPIEITCQRSFFFDGSSGNENVLVRLLIENDANKGLGVALPSGKLMVYQQDAAGLSHFLGEDSLQASTPGDKLELVIGQAFDLRVDRKRVSHERLARNRTRDTVEITLSSSRDKTAKVTLRERLYGFWEITQTQWGGQDLQHRVEDANRVEFDVELAPGKTETLRYVVEYGY